MLTLSSRPYAGLVLAALLSACATQPTPDTPSPTLATTPSNDFPTQARVEYVMQCMARKGGQNRDNLYACVCAADKLAEKLRYDDFVQAQTLGYLSNLAGDAGAAMRDAPQSRPLKKQLKDAETYASATCPPGHLPAKSADGR